MPSVDSHPKDSAAQIAALQARIAELEGNFESALTAAKLDALKEFAYGAGHEINNPLANISTRAQTLLRGETDPERRRMLATINRQAFRAHEMIADLMLFARPPRPHKRTLDLVRLTDTLIADLSAHARDQRTELVRIGGSNTVLVVADENHLAEAIRAILLNALEALGMGGRVETEVCSPGPANTREPLPRVIIRDNGPGIDARQLAHLFDPFFSGREAGRGLGFGLSKAWRIVTLHDGRIDVESQPGRGATFTISLPVTDATEIGNAA
jgi:signal transduction histidine kinase